MYWAVLLSFAFGQNLVPNPSFELAKADPTESITTTNNFTCEEWGSATKGTPDYYTLKRTSNFSAPANFWGIRAPHFGDAYVGIAVNHVGLDMYEYLQVKLTQKLVKDNYYCFSLFISSADIPNFSTNELDYILSVDKPYQNTGGIFKQTSYEKFIATKGFIEPKSWNKISSCFKAKGDEEYLTFGVLNQKCKHFNLRNGVGAFTGMYFYIDDVSLTPIKDIKECKCNELTVIKTPENNYNLALNKPMVLKNINFENNKAQLVSSSSNELNKLASYLKSSPNFKIEIIGYTDNVGNEKDNLILSNSRAKSVADFLINAGIAKDRITFKGLGNSTPIKPNNTEENRLLNRRVEFKIINPIEVNYSLPPQVIDSALFFLNNNCEYNKAILCYQNKLKTLNYTNILEKQLDYYNLACAYSLNNNADKAYENLKISIKMDTSTFSSYLTDPDFYNLINKKPWFAFILQNKPTKYKSMNDSLLFNLSKIAIQDQAFYSQLQCAESKYGNVSKQTNKIWAIKDSLNKKNLLMIEKYLADSINVLSNRVVGNVFSSKCFLVIQHSDSITMKKYLPIIKALYKKGETDGENYALLYDRVSLPKTKGYQYYGTQINTDKNIPYPILDEKNVDKRRKELGMEPLKDYLLRFGILYKPKK
ncbi:MAG TPA: OmpA family protein [Bacteroidia bacterium]|jgi:OOP family OmpA-OmpF porin|nr:OmpA family protein [Bacteroidia bacterium]